MKGQNKTGGGILVVVSWQMQAILAFETINHQRLRFRLAGLCCRRQATSIACPQIGASVAEDYN
jgi:hypothetical protein